MMDWLEFKSSDAVRGLMRGLGNAGNQVDEDGLQWTWLRALEMSVSFAGLRRHVVAFNNPDKGSFFITAVRKRARTASTGEYFLLLGIASLCDFGHIADKVGKRRTWQGFYARLEHEHARALASCVYHAATA
eukprot:gene13206-17553_t